ncbi:MAG: zeta toxin family protein [Lactobacillus sp.]
MIDQAHHHGFKVTLICIALASDELAVKSVLARFRKGGYGIPEITIKKQYPQSNQNLAAVAAKADNIFIFDNANRFVLVYVSKQGQVIKNTLRQFPWINQGIQA